MACKRPCARVITIGCLVAQLLLTVVAAASQLGFSQGSAPGGFFRGGESLQIDVFRPAAYACCLQLRWLPAPRAHPG